MQIKIILFYLFIILNYYLEFKGTVLLLVKAYV